MTVTFSRLDCSTDPHDFMVRALLVSAFGAAVCGLLSCSHLTSRGLGP